jgi:hypothetical protein
MAGSVPASGVRNGTVHLVVPATAGQYEVRFFANNGWGLIATSGHITVTVVQAIATPVITVSPMMPQIPDNTPKGAIVASYTITMSDGSAFTGTVGFGAPNFDSGGIFALNALSKTNGRIIVNPTGPGVGPNMTTITDHITLVATQ